MFRLLSFLFLLAIFPCVSAHRFGPFSLLTDHSLDFRLLSCLWALLDLITDKPVELRDDYSRAGLARSIFEI